MQQFQVPQFITIEDKILGPLTLKQTLFLGAGVGVIILAWFLFAPYLFFPIAFVTAGISASLAFLKIDDQPLYTIVKNATAYVFRPRLYTWAQQKSKKEKTKEEKKEAEEMQLRGIPKATESRLADLAWSLDIKSYETREHIL